GRRTDRFFFSGGRRHTRWPRDWSSDVCSSDLYTLALRRVGYESATHTVTVSGETSLDASLAISPFAAEPVVVTATPTPIRPDQRSEERRVGKRGRSGWSREHYKERLID